MRPREACVVSCLAVSGLCPPFGPSPCFLSLLPQPFFLSLRKSDLSPVFCTACCLTSKVIALFVLHLQEPWFVCSNCSSQFPLKFTMSSFLSFSNEFSLLLFHSSLISHLMFLSDLLLASCSFSLLINLFVLHVMGLDSTHPGP